MPKIMCEGINFSMGNGCEVDSVLSTTSENPIQNKVVTEALNNKLNNDDIPDWAKAKNKPTYTASEVGADTQGSANAVLSSAKSYTDTKIADLVNSAPETLDTLGEIAEALSDNEDVVTALNTTVGNKANASDLTAHTGNKSNPHEVTKTQLGLGNVENKSSATIRSELTKKDVTDALGFEPPTTNTTYSAFSGASASANGSAGLVPAPTKGNQSKYLRADGTWETPPNTTYGTVSETANGLATPTLLSTANGALQKSGGTMTGAVIGQANTNYATAQFRNITMSTSAPSGGSNGQVHFQYS